MARRIPDLNELASILVIKPSSLGDVVHTLPAVHAIKMSFPHLRINWLVNPEWAPLLQGNPDLFEIMPFPRREFNGWAGWRRFRKWAGEFAFRVPPNLALDFQGLLRSAYLGRKSGARVVVGMTDSREGAGWLHHIKVRVDPTAHAVDRYLEMARECRAKVDSIQFPLPSGNCPPAMDRAAVPRDFILLHPFSRGMNKSLTSSQVRIFCEAMAPVGVCVAGHVPDSNALDALPPNALNLLNKTTIPELIWLMRRARFTVSVDSGPMHIAAALSQNVLGIHTWSDPRMVGPYTPGCWVWKGGQILLRTEVDAVLARDNRQVEDEAVNRIAEFTWKKIEEAPPEAGKA